MDCGYLALCSTFAAPWSTLQWPLFTHSLTHSCSNRLLLPCNALLVPLRAIEGPVSCPRTLQTSQLAGPTEVQLWMVTMSFRIHSHFFPVKHEALQHFIQHSDYIYKSAGNLPNASTRASHCVAVSASDQTQYGLLIILRIKRSTSLNNTSNIPLPSPLSLRHRHRLSWRRYANTVDPQTSGVRTPSSDCEADKRLKQKARAEDGHR